MNNSVVIDKKFYWELFKSTFLISAFTVGGGFVIIPLLKAKYVDHYKWMSDKEALDLVSVAQSAPGVVAVNAAIIIGYRLAGDTGAAVTLLATWDSEGSVKKFVSLEENDSFLVRITI